MLLLCIWVQAGNLEQLGLIFTHEVLNVVLGCILDVRLLLANTGQDDGFWWYTVFQHQAHFSLGTNSREMRTGPSKPRSKTNHKKQQTCCITKKNQLSPDLNSNSLSDCNCCESAFITG